MGGVCTNFGSILLHSCSYPPESEMTKVLATSEHHDSHKVQTIVSHTINSIENYTTLDQQRKT